MRQPAVVPIRFNARGVVYGRMCDTLQQCVQKYKLGLGGELVDELVVAEVERLKAEQLSREELAFLVGVGDPKDHCFAWGCFCVRCEDLKTKLKRRLSDTGAHQEEER